jgi:hypothetical protein
MGLILSEPTKKVVEIPEVLAKFSVEDAKFHPKRPYRLRTSPGKKGRKTHKKNISPVFSQKKPFFRESPVFLAALLVLAQMAWAWSAGIHARSPLVKRGRGPPELLGPSSSPKNLP